MINRGGVRTVVTGAIASGNFDKYYKIPPKKNFLKVRQNLTELVANVLGLLLHRIVSGRCICNRKLESIVKTVLFMMRVVGFAPVDLKTLCRPWSR